VRWYSLEGFVGRVREAGFHVKLLSPADDGARGSWTPDDVAVLARPV